MIAKDGNVVETSFRKPWVEEMNTAASRISQGRPAKIIDGF